MSNYNNMAIASKKNEELGVEKLINHKSGSQRGLGFQGSHLKKCRAPRQKTRGSGVPSLHSTGLQLALIIISVRTLGRERLRAPGSMTKLSGLQGSKDLPSPFPFPSGPQQKPKTMQHQVELQ